MLLLVLLTGARPEDGVRDMIIISDIDENGININLKTRYKEDKIYVSFSNLNVSSQTCQQIKQELLYDTLSSHEQQQPCRYMND